MKQLHTLNHQKPYWINAYPKETADLISMMINNNPQACKDDVIPQGYGEFGLTATNPIPVYGIPENEDYLSKLRLQNGEKISWERVGSVSAENINKPIDKYLIQNRKGEKITYLYISPYHLNTSKKAPKGFKILR